VPPWRVEVAVRDDAAAANTTSGEPIDTGDLGFRMDRPSGDHWAVAKGLTSPDGNEIPVVVAHPATGAQLVVQVAEPMESPRQLAGLLHRRLAGEQLIEMTEPRPVRVDSGEDAYGFDFRVRGEARGRVAIIEAGDRVVLVVASWPERVDHKIVEEIDQVVRSVRGNDDADPVLGRPDKA